jgi:predicted RNase H-like HicB family nuclease
MATARLTAVVWQEGRRYVSKCPELGVASLGRTPQDAIAALREAVELYMENAELLGILDDLQPMLQAEERYTTSLEVAYP